MDRTWIIAIIFGVIFYFLINLRDKMRNKKAKEMAMQKANENNTSYEKEINDSYIKNSGKYKRNGLIVGILCIIIGIINFVSNWFSSNNISWQDFIFPIIIIFSGIFAIIYRVVINKNVKKIKENTITEE